MDARKVSYKRALTPLEVEMLYSPDLRVGLIVHYRFNGNSNEEGTDAKNAEVHGATLTEDMHGRPNSAYAFNGIDNYIMANLRQPQPKSLSIVLWVKPTSLQRDPDRSIIGIQDSAVL